MPVMSTTGKSAAVSGEQSKMNLDATLGYASKCEASEASYIALMISQYVAQVVFNQPFLRFSPKGAR